MGSSDPTSHERPRVPTCMSGADVWMISYVDIYAIDSVDFTPDRSSKKLPTGDRYLEYVFIYVDVFLVDSRRSDQRRLHSQEVQGNEKFLWPTRCLPRNIYSQVLTPWCQLGWPTLLVYVWRPYCQ